jgi:hypothetical protein
MIEGLRSPNAREHVRKSGVVRADRHNVPSPSGDPKSDIPKARGEEVLILGPKKVLWSVRVMLRNGVYDIMIVASNSRTNCSLLGNIASRSSCPDVAVMSTFE